MSSLGDQLLQDADALSRACEAGLGAMAGEAYDLVREYTSGPLTPADLRALDHPYAKRHGSPQQDPDIINRQTGAVFNAWTVEDPHPSGSGLVASVYNTDEKAGQYLEHGTSSMFSRQPHEKAGDMLEPRLEGFLADAVERELDP